MEQQSAAVRQYSPIAAHFFGVVADGCPASSKRLAMSPDDSSAVVPDAEDGGVGGIAAGGSCFPVASPFGLVTHL